MLAIKDVHKSFFQGARRLHVLKGIDLNVSAGDVVGIIGPSGAGKSTLLHILGGLDRPDQGEVVFESENVYKLKDIPRARLRNQKIGFIFQFYHLLPEFSALENVMLPALVKAQVTLDDIRAQGTALLEQVGLKDRLTHKPNELSGGEQQRVAIARALINEPKIVFCDEPTGNLDSESGQAIIDLLMQLNARNRQTLVMVTHDETIARRCHRVIYMKDGSLAS